MTWGWSHTNEAYSYVYDLWNTPKRTTPSLKSPIGAQSLSFCFCPRTKMARRLGETMTRDEVFAVLKSREITKVEVEFSGGNDEGGVDQINLFSGKNIVGELPLYGYSKHKDIDQLLVESLCDPIYTKYGGFAGEFHVKGVLTWDVEKLQVNMSGNEQTYSNDEFDEGV